MISSNVIWVSLHLYIVAISISTSYGNGNGNRIKNSITSDEEIQNFLIRFGHAKKEDTVMGSALFGESNLKQAILSYQYSSGLTPTGEMNEETQEMMNRPRCAVPDNLGYGALAKRKKRFITEGSKWDTTSITYNMINYTAHLPQSTNRNIVTKAFSLWQGVSPLTFTEVNQNAHIHIKYVVRAHGDGFPFDGPGGVLAHAYSPGGGGDAHFDDEENWTDGTPAGTNLLMVSTHEFGHALGLGHSNVQGSIMQAAYSGYQSQLTLSQDDIDGIRFLYPMSEAVQTTLGRQTPTKARAPTPGQTTTTAAVPKQTTTSPTTTTTTTQRPVLPATDICQGAFIDAIFVSYGITYAILGGDYYIFDYNGVRPGYPRRTAELYPQVGSSVDTALTFNAVMNGNTQVQPPYVFIFKQNQVWKYINTNQLVSGYPRYIYQEFPGVPDYLDAAFTWSGDGQIYFIKGSQYYKYIKGYGVASGYPRSMSDWYGIPNNVNAAFQWTNRRTYFFVKNQYYRFSDMLYRADSSYPRSTSEWWFGCTSAGFSNYPNNLEMSDNKTSQSNNTKLLSEYNEGLDQFLVVGLGGNQGSSADRNSFSLALCLVLCVSALCNFF